MRRFSATTSILLAGAARRRAAAAANSALADGAAAAAAPPPSAWMLTPSRRWQATVHTLSRLQAGGAPPHPLGWPRSASTLAPKRGRRRRDSESETPSSAAGGTISRSRSSRSGRAASAAPPLPPLPPPDAVTLARPPPRATDLPPGFPTSYAALSAAAEACPQTQGVTPDVMTGVDRGTMFAARDRMLAFTKAPTTRARALALYVNDALFNEAMAGFKRVLVRGSDAAATAALAALPRTDAGDDALFALFADHCLTRHADTMTTYR